MEAGAAARGTCYDEGGEGRAEGDTLSSVFPLLRADNARRKRRFGRIVKMDFGNKRRNRKERRRERKG